MGGGGGGGGDWENVGGIGIRETGECGLDRDTFSYRYPTHILLGGIAIASSPGPTFARVEPGSRNFNGNHKSGCLHGDAFFHHDIIPECPWPSE